MMKQHNRQEDAGIQERKSSRREQTVSGKRKEDTIRDSVKDVRSNRDRVRSKQTSELRKKRRRSRSSSSRSSSPRRHKRRKSDKSVKSRSRKKRKDLKRKDKKHKLKSRKSSSRKKYCTSSASSSDSESYRSSRTASPAERRGTWEGKKTDRAFTEEPVINKTRQKVPLLDVDKSTREPKRRHHYRSSSSEPREPSGKDISYGRSPDSSGKHGYSGFNHRGGQELKKSDMHGVDANERSLFRPPEARLRKTRHLSASTSPRASAERRSWDTHGSSPTATPQAMKSEQTLKPVTFSETSAQRLGVVEEDVNALEQKLRKRALANLMRHLSEKSNATESTSVGNNEDSSAIPEASQDFDVPPAAKEVKFRTSEHSNILDDGGREVVKEIDNKVSLRNVSEDVHHVEEGDEDANSNTEFTSRNKDDKLTTGYSAGSGSFTQGAEEIVFEGGQSTGVTYGKATSLEGRDIVVELVVDTEPFDFGIPYRGSTPSLFTVDKGGERKAKVKRELLSQVSEGNSEGNEDHSGDGKMFVQQAYDPQPGVPVTQSRLEPVTGEDLLDGETRECCNREEVALVSPDNAAITGELAHDVADVESTGITAFPQESPKTESVIEKKRSCWNDVSRPESSPKVRNDGDEAGDSAKFQQRSMSVTRGGESVQVSYKVYIPQRAAGAQRRLHR